MKADPTRTMDADAAAVLCLGGELGRSQSEDSLRDDPAFGSLVSSLRGVDVALRDAAAADDLSPGDVRRMRDASIRIARTQAIALIERGAAARPTRMRRLPGWSIGVAAAAVLMIVALVGWVNLAGPASFPAKGADGFEVAQNDGGGQWGTDRRDYSDLLAAFAPVDARRSDGDSAGVDTLDEGETQVDALTMLSTMAQD